MAVLSVSNRATNDVVCCSKHAVSRPISGENPTFPTKFDELVRDIGKVFDKTTKEGPLTFDDVDLESLKQLLDSYKSDESEWNKYAYADPARPYTRNGVEQYAEKADLLILVWNPGKSSMIHDHSGAHCVMKILKGNLLETQYDYPTDAESEKVNLHVKKRTLLHEGALAYISDHIGLHKMSNLSTSDTEKEEELQSIVQSDESCIVEESFSDEFLTTEFVNNSDTPAVSLHLYTPPYASKFGCHVFEKDGTKHKVMMSNLYSFKGRLLNPADHDTC